jgi:hypothetical protein
MWLLAHCLHGHYRVEMFAILLPGPLKNGLRLRVLTWLSNLENLASGPDAAVARLARDMLERCTGESFDADRAAWSSWALRQAPAYWAQISRNSACAMPGTPEEGDPAEGARYIQVVEATRSYFTRGSPGPAGVKYRTEMKALESPLYPYTLAVGRNCAHRTPGDYN